VTTPARLPPLEALRVFEAAARRGSFKDAADELCVTPSAVSRQIRALEEAVGCKLFRRLARAVVLTAAGTRYHAAVADALGRLERATGALRSARTARPLRLSVLSSFASQWLVPRMPRFEATHPGVDVEMEATTAYADFSRDEVDLGIRFGTGPWPGLHADRLMAIDFFPVASPALVRGDPPLRTPRDLARHTWLEETHVPDAWRGWLRAAGLADVTPLRTLRYDSAQLLTDAAVAGQGVALLSDLLVEHALADGRLVRPFDVVARSPLTYHLVGRPDELEEPRIRAFRTWLLREAATWARSRPAAPARVRRTQR
jgi:LysR family glycine cleavage system transcriptional activator